MKWECFFKGHKWKMVAFHNYSDISYSNPGVPSHSYTRICKRCAKSEWIVRYGQGHVDQDELREIVEGKKGECR